MKKQTTNRHDPITEQSDQQLAEHVPLLYDGEYFGIDDHYAQNPQCEDYHEFYFEVKRPQKSIFDAVLITIILAIIMGSLIVGFFSIILLINE